MVGASELGSNSGCTIHCLRDLAKSLSLSKSQFIHL